MLGTCAIIAALIKWPENNFQFTVGPYVLIMSRTRFMSCHLAGSRREIWSLSDCNWIRTHNHLVRKGTLNHIAKLADLAKWLSVRLRTKWSWVLVQLQSLTAGRWQFNSRHNKGTKMTINSRRIVLIGYWRFIKKVVVLECLLNSFKQFVFYSPHVFNLLTVLFLV